MTFESLDHAQGVFAALDVLAVIARKRDDLDGATQYLERSMARYFSEPSLPSQIFSSCELVPEMICNKLFSSLLALERGSFDGWGDSGSVGTLISSDTGLIACC